MKSVESDSQNSQTNVETTDYTNRGAAIVMEQPCCDNVESKVAVGSSSQLINMDNTTSPSLEIMQEDKDLMSDASLSVLLKKSRENETLQRLQDVKTQQVQISESPPISVYVDERVELGDSSCTGRNLALCNTTTATVKQCTDIQPITEDDAKKEISEYQTQDSKAFSGAHCNESETVISDTVASELTEVKGEKARISEIEADVQNHVQMTQKQVCMYMYEKFLALPVSLLY